MRRWLTVWSRSSPCSMWPCWPWATARAPARCPGGRSLSPLHDAAAWHAEWHLDGATTDTVTGPVLMAVDADGLVLRATRGACQKRFANPAQVAVGSISTGVTAVELPALAEVLGVAILPDGPPARVRSRPGLRGGHLRLDGLRQTWQPLAREAAGIWRLDPDTTAEQVTGPAGGDYPARLRAPVRDQPRRQSRRGQLPGGVFYLVAPRPRHRRCRRPATTSCAWRPGRGRAATSSSGPPPSAEPGWPRSRPSPARPSACSTMPRRGEAPLAIAAAGGYVVVQLGDDLMVSEDGGDTSRPSARPAERPLRASQRADHGRGDRVAEGLLVEPPAVSHDRLGVPAAARLAATPGRCPRPLGGRRRGPFTPSATVSR